MVRSRIFALSCVFKGFPCPTPTHRPFDIICVLSTSVPLSKVQIGCGGLQPPYPAIQCQAFELTPSLRSRSRFFPVPDALSRIVAGAAMARFLPFDQRRRLASAQFSRYRATGTEIASRGRRNRIGQFPLEDYALALAGSLRIGRRNC